MKHQVVWSACSVDNPETGESVILKTGEFLPEWVEDYTKFVLVQTGAVKAVGDDTEPAAPSPDPVRLIEHPPLTSDAALAEKDTLAGAAAARLRAAKDEPTDDGDKPKPYASKEVWLAYAVSQREDGVSEEDATAALTDKTKAELVAEFGG